MYSLVAIVVLVNSIHARKPKWCTIPQVRGFRTKWTYIMSYLSVCLSVCLSDCPASKERFFNEG
ncbi:hypothetical protein KC19_7G180200 [Ceratodon purpureus]|uniref:Uncharacterized protein n=1 Tax=Ceratodon purpureus TaxID=3225 RepID=A0A8T0H9S7_CERPU|nr:hypothetical protein KC19_7G180200 [Ceratodon purpureus]